MRNGKKGCCDKRFLISAEVITVISELRRLFFLGPTRNHLQRGYMKNRDGVKAVRFPVAFRLRRCDGQGSLGDEEKVGMGYIIVLAGACDDAKRLKGTHRESLADVVCGDHNQVFR